MVQFIKNRFKGSEMTHKNEETVVDAQMHHPFRCLVAGPSQSGKSTFVRNLLLWQNDIIDIRFDYVMIVLGTAETLLPWKEYFRNLNHSEMVHISRAKMVCKMHTPVYLFDGCSNEFQHHHLVSTNHTF